MKKLILLCGLLAVAACAPTPAPVPSNTTAHNPRDTTNDCPTADGNPCK